MRILKTYMALVAIALFLFSSCSKDETVNGSDAVSNDVASLYLGPVLANMSNLNRQQITTPDCSDLSAEYAQIRLIYGPDDTVVTVTVKIESDDQGLFTLYDDKLEIPVPSGETTVEVVITDFVVLNDLTENGGVPTWIAPKEGSEFEDFVEDALNSDVINLRAGSKNYVNIDVICFDDREVNQYGYQFFDITPIALSKLCVFANYCITPNGRDRVANYTFDLYTFSGGTEEDDPITDGNLYTLINENHDSPDTGLDGETYYAEPLCLPIPKGDDDNGDVPYLYWEMNLEDWENYYGEAPDLTLSGYLTWNQVKEYLNQDGDDTTVDYIHLFFNCGPGGGDPLCQIDTDQDGVPDCDDVCQGSDDKLDDDDDGVPDGCDECSDGDDNADEDEDGVPDACDNCPKVANADGQDDDDDGDGFGNACDLCLDTAGGSFGCPDDECIGRDLDGDGFIGDCDCDDSDPSKTDDCDDGEVGCETAWMFGDHTFTNKDDDGLSVSAKWGWAEYFEVGQSPETFNFYAGAGQNNTSNGYLAGTVEVSKSGSTLIIEVTAANDVDISEIAIYTSYLKPTTASPGQFDKLDDVQGEKDSSPGAVNTYTFDYPGNDPIWIAVHGDVCGSDD